VNFTVNIHCCCNIQSTSGIAN